MQRLHQCKPRVTGLQHLVPHLKSKKRGTREDMMLHKEGVSRGSGLDLRAASSCCQQQLAQGVNVSIDSAAFLPRCQTA